MPQLVRVVALALAVTVGVQVPESSAASPCTVLRDARGDADGAGGGLPFPTELDLLSASLHVVGTNLLVDLTTVAAPTATRRRGRPGA